MSRSLVLALCGAALVASACDSPLGSLEPDTRLLIFRFDGTSGDLYSIHPDGSGAARLTNDPAREYCPRWSPDREFIAYVAERDSVLRQGQRVAAPALYVMKADGSESRQVVAAPTTLHMGCPDWSPDGTRLVYDRVEPGERLPFLYVVLADGSGETRLGTGDGRSARWSPDGSTLAFLSQTPGWPRVTLADADGTNRRQIASPCAKYQGPAAWSPDGKRLAFACETRHGVELFTSRVDGTDAVRILPPVPGRPAAVLEPIWSPDGRHIAFSRVHREETDLDIHIVESRGGFPVRITRTRGNEVVGDWR